jgi:hypothetical protein
LRRFCWASIQIAEPSKEAMGGGRIGKPSAIGETGALDTYRAELKWLNALPGQPSTHFGELIANSLIG